MLAHTAGAQQGSAGFTDVDVEGIHAPGIAALASKGLIERTECSPGMFCPSDTLPRWVMAVWLVRAVDGGDPAGEGETRFDDVDADAWWAPHTERLAELGITQGCSTEPLQYCPDRLVTRGQMASFLTRAFDLQPAEQAGFTDTESSVHESSINALAAARITAGCSRTPMRYCPQRHVTRARTATFLARALGLVPLPEPPPDRGYPPSVTAILYRSSAGIWMAQLDGSDPIELSADGYGAVLVRLADADIEEVADWLEDSYRRVAPAPLIRQLDDGQFL